MNLGFEFWLRPGIALDAIRPAIPVDAKLITIHASWCSNGGESYLRALAAVLQPSAVAGAR